MFANRHLDVTNNLPPKDDGLEDEFPFLGLVVGKISTPPPNIARAAKHLKYP